MKLVLMVLAIAYSVVGWAVDAMPKANSKGKMAVTSAAAQSQAELKMMPAKVLAVSIQNKRADLFVFDANSDSTRESEGIVPGAIALASVTQYEAKTTLPSNKEAHLVFYCANTMCTASHEAAKVAMGAGYKNVYVMPEGIEGWKQAGNKVAKYSKKS